MESPVGCAGVTHERVRVKQFSGSPVLRQTANDERAMDESNVTEHAFA